MLVQTVRVSGCETLSESRCAKCRNFRTHLHVKLSQADHFEECVRVAHNRHAKYGNMPRESLVERLKKHRGETVT